MQLKYFQRAAQLNHISRAALELNIPQPSLSKTISQLEKELGVVLFDRHGKSVELNEYGEIFLNKVNIALSALEDGKIELADLSDKPFGNIKLAVLSASSMLPELLSLFSTTYPSISFQLIQHPQESSSKPSFDLCISSFPTEIAKSNFASLMTEEIFLAVPVNHPLASRNSIRLSEASNEKFISLEKGKDLRKITDYLCYSAGFIPNVIFESDDPATVRGLIKAGQGVAFIPSISWRDAKSSHITLLHIEDPICKRTIHLSWPEDRYMKQTVRLFRDFTVNYFKNNFLNE
ncbi:MAG: LysR family transcriptional regulator [Bacillota bacterium]|nr:LysR family transcriptional regulator [Bacillota bacterium]